VHRRKIWLLAVVLVLSLRASAQVFDLSQAPVQITELHGLARFHTGDDPDGKLGWSGPGFDDSKWPLLRLDKRWSDQGYAGYTGFAWYRFQIVVPPKAAHLAIYNPYLETSWQIFVDGRLVGEYGQMPPHEKVIQRDEGVEPIVPIPDQLLFPGKPLQVAIRMWHWPYYASFPTGPQEPFVFGSAALVEKQHQFAFLSEQRGRSGWNALFPGELVAALAGFGFFLLRRGEFEYLWFAALELSLAANCLMNSSVGALWPADFRVNYLVSGLVVGAYSVLWPCFIVAFLRERKGPLFWASVITGALAAPAFLPYIFQWMSASNWIIFIYLVAVPSMVFTWLLVWFPARRGNLDARLLLFPKSLEYAAVLIQGFIWTLIFTGHLASFNALNDFYQNVINWPFTCSLQVLANSIAQIAVLAILILRFARSRRDEERMKSELEAARLVQQVLVPAEMPEVPGIHIETVYKPAGEVGGDFFQVIATPGGGVLAVIGDVSGKGMPAAMTVSLLVGTFRTLAHYTQSPCEILRAMNQRMLARTQGGFTTCLVVRADPDGKLTAANAGHLAPYCGGEELKIENGLPLGLSADTEYAEVTFQLAPGAQLTLLTDGVVEARAAGGELFGFERSRELSTATAQHIAEIAHRFGQEDDITVLTLERLAVVSPV
jgi:hypothetical protein